MKCHYSHHSSNSFPTGDAAWAGPVVLIPTNTDDCLGIRLDSEKAGGKAFKINLVTPDNGEQFVVGLSNGTLTNIEGFQADDAELTVTIDREDLLMTKMVQFQLGFELLPGTGAKDLTPEMNTFQQEDPGSSIGG